MSGKGLLGKEDAECPFRARSNPDGQVATFVFKYSGEGMFDKVEYGSDSDSCNEDSETSVDASDMTHVLQDAYAEYDDSNSKSCRAPRTLRRNSTKTSSGPRRSPSSQPTNREDAQDSRSARKPDSRDRMARFRRDKQN